MSKKKIKLYDYTNSPSATSPDQGDNVYTQINPLIRSYLDRNVEFEIDFSKINNLTTAFLNNSLGKLFYEFETDKLLSLISFTGLSTTMQIKTLKLTLSNALALSQVNDHSEI